MKIFFKSRIFVIMKFINVFNKYAPGTLHEIIAEIRKIFDRTTVIEEDYERKVNKQNSLAVDGTGTKYPTVDAINSGTINISDYNNDFLLMGG